jgi:predicted transcriptional regulator of viral defense system
MATKRPASVLREEFARGDPLSLEEAARLAGGVSQASQALTYLAEQGVFTNVRQRLWVRSGAPVDPYRLGARVTSPYAFAYGTALALHGAGSAERSEILISSPRRFETFEFEGGAYRRVRPWFEDGRAKVTVGPEFVWATTPERTLVECVRVPTDAGGISEVLRAGGALPRLDPQKVLEWADRFGEANLAARLGFVLETVGRPREELAVLPELERRRPKAKAYLQPGTRGGRFVARWNLIVPEHLLAPQAEPA